MSHSGNARKSQNKTRQGQGNKLSQTPKKMNYKICVSHMQLSIPKQNKKNITRKKRDKKGKRQNPSFVIHGFPKQKNETRKRRKLYQ